MALSFLNQLKEKLIQVQVFKEDTKIKSVKVKKSSLNGKASDYKKNVLLVLHLNVHILGKFGVRRIKKPPAIQVALQRIGLGWGKKVM